jgi:hypothetical protein
LRNSPLTFNTIQAATARVAHMPSGPQWSSQNITVEGYRTTEPIILYYRDSAECVEYLLNNPLFENNMNFIPVKHYTANGKRVVREPISAQQAWETQVGLFLVEPCIVV